MTAVESSLRGAENRAEAGDVLIRSFRDPAGAVYRHGHRILRAVRPDSVAELDEFLITHTARESMDAGKLVRSLRISPDEFPIPEDDLWQPGTAFYEHERVWFPSYPHEWPAELLYSAGRLTADLFQAALSEGFGLKDATPYNVLYQGASPLFVDVLSFERRDPRDATWIAYAQFVRTFLLPLLAHHEFGVPAADIFLRRRDGWEPEEIYRWAGLRKLLSPAFLSLVTLPHWMGRRMADSASNATSETYRPPLLDSPEKARFVLDHLLDDCRGKLDRLQPRPTASAWTEYLDHKSLYRPAQLEQKERFVQEALDLVKPRTALDVGANEGRFSFLAARHGASVVAIDTDAAVAGNVWRQASAQGLDVLPLVVDLTRPTPALGWRNQECASFLDRARGSFDLVMMLAVIHHMLVSERIPLGEVLRQAAELTRGYLLIEFVAPSDPMFVRIARGREMLHQDLTRGAFEAAASAHFDLVKAQPLDGLDRCLYLYRLRPTNV